MIVNWRETLNCVGLVESLTVTFAVVAPATVGVPEITPLAALIVRPAGSPVALHVYDGVPPVAATVAEYAVLITPSERAVVVIERPGAITSVIRFVAHWGGLLESQTVRSTVADPADAGVPEITPLDALITSADGRPAADHV